MKEVRRFSLMNEKGEEYSLMDIENYCLLTSPSGFGYSYSTNYERVGNTFVENLRQLQQGQITGTINCLYYDNFKKLVDFIEKAKKLMLLYAIPYKSGTREYLRDINIKDLTKTEIQVNGVISETITFECLSLWYSKNVAQYTIVPQEDEIRWNYKWDSRFTSYNSRSLHIKNDGHIEAPIELSINGEVINPVIELYVEGQLIQEIPFTVRIEQYEKFLYCSKDNDFYVQKQNTDATKENLFNLDVIDFDNNNVLKIPPDKSCEIRLTADDDISNAEITVYIYYKAI